MRRLQLIVIVFLIGCTPARTPPPALPDRFPPPSPARLLALQHSGTYSARLLAASAPGREITLELNPDFTARRTIDYRNGEPPIVSSGSWKSPRINELEVVLARTDGAAAPELMTFRVDGPRLSAVVYDMAAWGQDGLVLTRQMGIVAGALPGTKWKLEEIYLPGEGDLVTRHRPLDPEHYTIEFQMNGTLNVRADCNHGSGTYTDDDHRLIIGRIVTTLMACPEGSLDRVYLVNLSAVASWFIRGGRLVLELPIDSGSLRFVRAGNG